jgi:hypothetical protein
MNKPDLVQSQATDRLPSFSTLITQLSSPQIPPSSANSLPTIKSAPIAPPDLPLHSFSTLITQLPSPQIPPSSANSLPTIKSAPIAPPDLPLHSFCSLNSPLASTTSATSSVYLPLPFLTLPSHQQPLHSDSKFSHTAPKTKKVQKVSHDGKRVGKTVPKMPEDAFHLVGSIHGPKYVCTFPKCNKVYSARDSNAKSHWMTHQNIMPYSCIHCRKPFTRKYDCQRHEKLHLSDQKQCQSPGSLESQS